MVKFKDKLLIILFLLFIFGTAVMFLLLPKKTFSQNEKRDLAKLPKLSVSAVFDGSFENGTEDYLTDHFPFKDKWVAVNSYFNLYTGRNGVSGVYKGKDGYLMNTPLTDNDEDFESNMAVIKAFCEKTTVPVSVMIVPTTGSIMTDKLPKNHAPYNDDTYIDRAKEILTGCADFTDVRERFRELASEGEQVFYKTDHHWTSLGAYEAYKMYRADAYERDDFTVECYPDFYGTTYSKSALWNESGENIELWTHPVNVRVTIRESGKTSDSMFFREHLGDADKYPVFLDGNHDLVRIENADADGGKTLIIRDSYAQCFAPFSALHESVTDLVDLRYFYDSVSELVKNENYDRILILYGLENLVEFTDIGILE